MRLPRLAKLWPSQASSRSQATPPRQAKPVQYNTSEAKDLFCALLRRVRRGEEVVIAHAGHPVAKLVPYRGEPGYPGVIRARLVIAKEPPPEGG